MQVERECQECGATFEIYRPLLKHGQGKYCSPECSHEAQRQGKTKKCKHCGDEFYRPPSADGPYCSRECFHADRDYKSGPENPQWDRVEVECEVCGDSFYLTPSVLERGRKCCSWECRNISMGERRGPNHPLYERVEIECEWCGAPFKVKPARLGRARFCSRQCLGAYVTSEQGGRQSSIELAIKEELEKLGLNYEEQHRIGKWLVDFYLPSANLVIECDGEYWHSLPEVVERDKRKDKYLKKHGYTVVRIDEADIRQDAFRALADALN